MKKQLYAALAVTNEIKINYFGHEITVKASGENGIVGSIPVFSNKKKAKKYGGKDCRIITLEKISNPPIDKTLGSEYY